MDWKEFLKKYGIYIAIGLVALYFLFRRSSPARPSVPAGGRLPAGTAGGATTVGGPLRQQTTATPTATQPQLRRGGTPGSGAATAGAYAGLIFSGINQFMNLLDRISGVSTRQSRTPPTFPGNPRVPQRKQDGLIRIIDASGVETVIASGYYDIPPDFGVPSDYWGTSDSGGTFYNDAFGDSANPYGDFPGLGNGGGGSIGDIGFFDSMIPELMDTISRRGFDPPGESEVPRIVIPGYGEF